MLNKELLLAQDKRPMATVDLGINELAYLVSYNVRISFLDEGREQWLPLRKGDTLNAVLQVPVGGRIKISIDENSGVTDSFCYDGDANGAELLLSEARAYTFRIVKEKASIYLYTSIAK